MLHRSRTGTLSTEIIADTLQLLGKRSDNPGGQGGYQQVAPAQQGGYQPQGGYQQPAQPAFQQPGVQQPGMQPQSYAPVQQPMPQQAAGADMPEDDLPF